MSCPSELEEWKSFLCRDTFPCLPERSKAAAAFSLSTLQMWLRHLSTRTCVKLTGDSIKDLLLGLKGKKNMFQPFKQNHFCFKLVLSLPQWLRDMRTTKRLWAHHLPVLHGDPTLPFQTEVSLEALPRWHQRGHVFSSCYTNLMEILETWTQMYLSLSHTLPTMPEHHYLCQHGVSLQMHLLLC